MKAIPIKIDGMQFRSKLEARWDRLFNKFGWNYQYEPEVPDIVGYQPDFAIYPEKEAQNPVICHHWKNSYNTLYVEVKPLKYLEEFFESHYDQQRLKIINSGILNKHALIIVGSNWQYPNERMGYTFGFLFHDKNQENLSSYQFKFSYRHFTKNDINPKKIGINLFHTYELYRKQEGEKDADGVNYNCVSCPIEFYDDGSLDEEGAYINSYGTRLRDRPWNKAHTFVRTCWNEAWSELQWKPKLTLDQKIQRVKTIQEMIELGKNEEEEINKIEGSF